MERVLVYGMTYNLGGIESYLMNLLERLDPQQLQ
ncbi:MAG: glycosyltransferase family 1 protein, partial [Clostridiaceae bacterium]|nr:glycosyltransferase family 1 protein [Clostridiaceae bacterium]